MTAKRLRAYGLIVAAVIWSVYVWNMASPGCRDRGGSVKGGDFAHLYVLGTVALEHRGTDLYNIAAQKDLMAQRVPQAAGIYYFPIYPPQVAVALAPLARLPYGTALLAWLSLGCLLYLVCCWKLLQCCPDIGGHRLLICLLAVAFPGFFQAVLWGQTSFLALACFALMFLALRSKRNFAAGLALGLLAFKPQLGLAAAVALLADQDWAALFGTALAAIAEFAVGWLYFGFSPIIQWIRSVTHIFDAMARLEPKPYQAYSLRIFWTLLHIPPRISLFLYFISAAVILFFTITVWRSSLPLKVRFAALLFSTVLVSPHLIVYDTVILAPAFLFLGEWLIPQATGAWKSWMGIVLYAAYVSPLLGAFTRQVRVQVAVLIMSVVVLMIWRRQRMQMPEPDYASR